MSQNETLEVDTHLKNLYEQNRTLSQPWYSLCIAFYSILVIIGKSKISVQNFTTRLWPSNIQFTYSYLPNIRGGLFIIGNGFHPWPLHLLILGKISTLDTLFHLVNYFLPSLPVSRFCHPPRLLGPPLILGR